MFYEIITSFAFTAIVKLILGFILTGIIGLERSSWNKPAGFRTHSLVGVSAVLVMLCGEYMAQKYDVDPSRIPAQLLSGIGFLGAGTIIRNGINVKGLTTAASLLAVTCIGLIVGSGFFWLGIVATVIVYFILSYSYLIFSRLDHFSVFKIEIVADLESKEVMKSVQSLLTEKSIIINEISNSETISEDEEKQKIINIVGKYSKKNEIGLNDLITSLSNIDGVIKVEEPQDTI